ncbi:hypothetical protein M011DRAFT_466325 [Sporormia fimetaria CBS 119925]|uniref:Uncharacterized protein n=1 Tax=Sporormia fimetaria CBS 119925 TaxID=1340428 RepID=A0A6A6VF37_9PLEO|nr:hypothetical protein M011DRAFT_466325 [Sporormia fimetaria CBS 119925]
MFVPRSLISKGVRGAEVSTNLSAPKKRKRTASNSDPQTSETVSPSAENDAQPPAKRAKAAQNPNPEINPEYLGVLVCGMELIFSDYALQNDAQKSWLERHSRTIGDANSWFHLAAILTHPTISTLNPPPTQTLLQRALLEHPSQYLELHSETFHVRRTPSTYPLPFIPVDSFSIIDSETNLTFWNERTIYVEPHTHELCKTPASVAYWLKVHGALREKWLPVQAVKTLCNSCALVVLSGNVGHEGMWEGWRQKGRPEWWKCLTWWEWKGRREEYVEVLRREKGEKGEKGVGRKGREALGIGREEKVEEKGGGEGTMAEGKRAIGGEAAEEEKTALKKSGEEKNRVQDDTSGENIDSAAKDQMTDDDAKKKRRKKKKKNNTKNTKNGTTR